MANLRSTEDLLMGGPPRAEAYIAEIMSVRRFYSSYSANSHLLWCLRKGIWLCCVSTTRKP